MTYTTGSSASSARGHAASGPESRRSSKRYKAWASRVTGRTHCVPIAVNDGDLNVLGSATQGSRRQHPQLLSTAWGAPTWRSLFGDQGITLATISGVIAWPRKDLPAR
jgi:hypothetical protein